MPKRRFLRRSECDESSSSSMGNSDSREPMPLMGINLSHSEDDSNMERQSSQHRHQGNHSRHNFRSDNRNFTRKSLLPAPFPINDRNDQMNPTPHFPINEMLDQMNPTPPFPINERNDQMNPTPPFPFPPNERNVPMNPIPPYPFPPNERNVPMNPIPPFPFPPNERNAPINSMPPFPFPPNERHAPVNQLPPFSSNERNAQMNQLPPFPSNEMNAPMNQLPPFSSNERNVQINQLPPYSSNERNVPMNHLPPFSSNERNVQMNQMPPFPSNERNVPMNQLPPFSSSDRNIPMNNLPPFSSKERNVPMNQLPPFSSNERNVLPPFNFSSNDGNGPPNVLPPFPFSSSDGNVQLNPLPPFPFTSNEATAPMNTIPSYSSRNESSSMNTMRHRPLSNDNSSMNPLPSFPLPPNENNSAVNPLVLFPPPPTENVPPIHSLPPCHLPPNDKIPSINPLPPLPSQPNEKIPYIKLMPPSSLSSNEKNSPVNTSTLLSCSLDKKDVLVTPLENKNIPKIIPLPTLPSENNMESSSAKPLELASDETSSPQIKTPAVTKVKLRTLGKEAAKKRLKSYTAGNLLSKEKKLVADEKVATKEDEPVAKKKKTEKQSFIRQIKEEETRLKEVLVLHNCNAKYLGTGLAHLQGLMDDPVAFSKFEERGRVLKTRIEKDELPQPKEREPRESSSSHHNRKHRSEKDSSTARRKRKIIPKSWKQLKSLNITISDLHPNEESDTTVSPLKVESRQSEETLRHFSPLRDKTWIGLSMHKPLISLRVSRSTGHSKKEYCGSMVRTTVTKPHITFSKNSGKITRHYMTRAEAKYRNKPSRQIWNTMKRIWEADRMQERNLTRNSSWYIKDWMSVDHDYTLNTDNLTMSSASALTDLGKKYRDSDLSCDEDALPEDIKSDLQTTNKQMSDDFPDIENSSVVSEELSETSAKNICETSPKDVSLLLTDESVKFSEEVADGFVSSDVDSDILEETIDRTNIEDNLNDSRDVSVSTSVEKKSSQENSPQISTHLEPSDESVQSDESMDSPSPVDDQLTIINGKNVSELSLKEVKQLLCSGTIDKKEKKSLKEIKDVLKKVKKEKKKLKKERKRMRREKKRQKKQEKKLAAQKKHASNVEVKTPVSTEVTDIPVENILTDVVTECVQHVAVPVEAIDTVVSAVPMEIAEPVETSISTVVSETVEASISTVVSETVEASISTVVSETVEASISTVVSETAEASISSVASDPMVLFNIVDQCAEEEVCNPVEQSDSDSLYNPEEPQLSDSNYSPHNHFKENDKYSPTSSPFYFSDTSEPSPNTSFSFDSGGVEHSNLTTVLQVQDSLPPKEAIQPLSENTSAKPLYTESSSALEVSAPNIDLNSIPTPPSKSSVTTSVRTPIATIPVPVPPPSLVVPLPVPPVDRQYFENITSNVRKEVNQLPIMAPKLHHTNDGADVRPVTFRLSLNKMPTTKLAKPSLAGMFQEDIDDLNKDAGRSTRPGPKELFKNFGRVEPEELSLYKSLNETKRTNEIEAVASNQAIYSPSQCTADINPAKIPPSRDEPPELSIPTDNKECLPKQDAPHERPHSRGSKHSTSPSKDRKKRSSVSPSRRHRDRSRSRSPQHHGRSSYSSRSRSRRSPRHRRSGSRSPRRFGGRYRDERRSSKGSYEKRSRSPSPRRIYHERTRDPERMSPKPSSASSNKISQPTSEPSYNTDIKRIESVTNMGENRPVFDVNLSEIDLPTDSSNYEDNNQYRKHSDDSFYDSISSPKRPSLIERLRNEHGLYLEDSPATFDSSNNSFDLQPVEDQQGYWEDSQVQPGGAAARVIRVGNVLQILPQELPSLEEQPKQSVEPQKVAEPEPPKATTTIQTHSVVPLSPSFSPPPDGRISPLPPPSPVSPKETIPEVVAPPRPLVGGPIPGLSSEALISAAAAASAASNVPFAQLISVLQEQNLLPKSVPIPEQKAEPAKEKSPEPVLPEPDNKKIDLEALRNASRERRLRKRQEKERRREERKRQREEEIARQTALQQAEEDDDEALIKEAISEVPELEGPVPDFYLMADEDMNDINPVHSSLSLPPPEKGILVLPTYKDESCSLQKSVWFADGIIPGEGTSASGGGESIVDVKDTPAKSVKRKLKKDRPSQKKIRTREIKMFNRDGDGICSPPPPPTDPPPPDAIRLYPGWTHCTYTSPDTVVLFTQQLMNTEETTVMIPPGMLVHSTGLMGAAGS